MANAGKMGDESNKDAKHAPVPRLLSRQSITLHFKNTTWEQIARGELAYVPIHQNPIYMMDSAMMNQYNKFKDIWSTMELHHLNYKMSNFIMLHDDYKVQGGTPVDTTTFVQVNYLLKHEVKGQHEFFKLMNINDHKELTGNDITYNLNNGTNAQSQLTKLKGYTDFNNLAIIPSKVGYAAGYTPGSNLYFESDGTLRNAYIPPDTTVTEFRKFSGNFNPHPGLYTKPGETITYARNLNSTIPIKYGDVVSSSVNTNLENVELMRVKHNDFFNERNGVQVADKLYSAQFAYPGNNRPFLSRSTNFSREQAILNPKRHKQLNHTFLTMPPILKANGALLGQRVSFMMETEFCITLNFTESVFQAEANDDHLYLAQKDAIIVRPNIYGKMKPAPPEPVQGQGFCTTGYHLVCNPLEPTNLCPDNDDYENLFLWLGQLSSTEFKGIFHWQAPQPEGPDFVDIGTVNEVLSADTFLRTESLAASWTATVGSKTTAVVTVTNPILDQGTTNIYTIVLFGDSFNYNETKARWLGDEPPQKLYVLIDMPQFKYVMEDRGGHCIKDAAPTKKRKLDVFENEVQADPVKYVSVKDECTAFYC